MRKPFLQPSPIAEELPVRGPTKPTRSGGLEHAERKAITAIRSNAKRSAEKPLEPLRVCTEHLVIN
jgi:hypothetical protein